MTGKLYTPPKLPGLREVMRRILFVALLLCGVTLIVYFEGGLRDSRSGTHPGFWDCFYFALVTITTVGYGDIVPVDTMSRLVRCDCADPGAFHCVDDDFWNRVSIDLATLSGGISDEERSP